MEPEKRGTYFQFFCKPLNFSVCIGQAEAVVYTVKCVRRPYLHEAIIQHKYC